MRMMNITVKSNSTIHIWNANEMLPPIPIFSIFFFFSFLTFDFVCIVFSSSQTRITTKYQIELWFSSFTSDSNINFSTTPSKRLVNHLFFFGIITLLCVYLYRNFFALNCISYQFRTTQKIIPYFRFIFSFL